MVLNFKNYLPPREDLEPLLLLLPDELRDPLLPIELEPDELRVLLPELYEGVELLCPLLPKEELDELSQPDD
jgi:hypothetical protein